MKVSIPTPLRSYTGQEAVVEAEGEPEAAEEEGEPDTA